MAGSGPTVPILNWYRKHDLDRQLTWLERTGAGAVGVDCSTLYGARRWREVRSALAYIRTVLPEAELHVYGASSADRVEDLALLDRSFSTRLAPLPWPAPARSSTKTCVPAPGPRIRVSVC